MTYLVIDKDGKTLIKPIKASAFHNKPTLNYIEKKCKENEQKRLPAKKHIKTAIEWAMQSKPQSLAEMAKLLRHERIDLVVRRNEQGRVFGMTYIDHEKKTVFNGSDIDKEYAAKRILERLGMAPQQQSEKEQQQQQIAVQQKGHSQDKQGITAKGKAGTPAKQQEAKKPKEKEPVRKELLIGA